LKGAIVQRPRRLARIQGFGIDTVAAAAAENPDVLRLENLDTDLAPPPEAVAATCEAASRDDANSYLPFTGRLDLKRAISARVAARSGVTYDAESQIVVTATDGDALLDVLLALTDPGDEVVLTDPTYAGMLNRVHLVGAVPRLVSAHVIDGEWRLDLDQLKAVVGPRTRALFLQNPTFPSGQLFDNREWASIEGLCSDNDLWLIYWSIFEGVVFDGRPIIHPASLPLLGDRLVTVGTISIEQRMIGWRLGWVIAPPTVLPDIALVHIYNAVAPGGIAQAAALAAYNATDDGLSRCVAEWQLRRDTVLEQLDGLPVIRAAGTWSQLFDVAALGLDPERFSHSLLRHNVAATPMTGWGGPVADRHIRLVFSNEPVERLNLLGDRVRAALRDHGI
jgi:aspartate/methionine/tyrosine aminotransferase